MMSGRPGHEPLKFLPDESRGLPPPKLNDPRLVYTGFLGYCAGLLNNALRRRPVLKAVQLFFKNWRRVYALCQACTPLIPVPGKLKQADLFIRGQPGLQSLHRQLLYVTSFYFVGYFFLKRQEYLYAVRDHDMFGYMKLHPEDFPEKEKKTYGEIFEVFHPVR